MIHDSVVTGSRLSRRGVSASILRWSLVAAFTLAILSGRGSALASSPRGGQFTEHNMNGRYIVGGTPWEVSSTSPSSAVPKVAVDYLDLDGKGNLPSGEETINYDTPGSGDSFTCLLAGSYTIDSPTGRCILTLNLTFGSGG